MPWVLSIRAVRRGASIAAAILAAAASRAPACSVSDDYVRPTNFELVQVADAIVIASAIRETEADDDTHVTFRVEEALKGAPPATLTIGWAQLGRTRPSDLTQLAGSHPEGHMGPCNRTTFAKGGRYLLFLGRSGEGEWHQLGFAFSRINEDYAGEGTVWMRTVRRYLRLQQRLGPREQIDGLKEMLRLRRTPEGASLTEPELADIADHLSSLSPYKATFYLLDAYARLERGEAPEFGIRSPAADQEVSAAEALTRALLDRPDAGSNFDAEAQKRFVLASLVKGEHPEALALFERFFAEEDVRSAEFALALRFLANNGHYPRVFEWIDNRLLAVLPTLTMAEARQLAGAVYQAQQGDSYDPGEERWRHHPLALARWPSIALVIYALELNPFDDESRFRFEDALNEIPLVDFRQSPLLALARAEGYDERVRDWAVRELEDDRKRREWATAGISEELTDDPALLPLRVLTIAWTSDDARVLRKIFCQSDRRRRLVILAMADADENYGGLFPAIAASPALSEEDRNELIRSLARFASREAVSGQGIFGGLDRAQFELLKRLVGGEKIEAEPIACPR